MSTKTLSWGLFGGTPSVSSEVKNRQSASRHNRKTVVMSRPAVSRSRGRSFGLSRLSLRTYIGAGLAAAVVLMFLVYIFGINQSAAKGYEITKQKNKLDALIESNKKLMVQSAEVGSIVKIQDEAASDHLVQISSQEYLQANQLSQR